MKTFNIALGTVLAAGLSAALPSISHAQYPGGYGQQNSALVEQRKQVKEAEAEALRIQREMNKIKGRLQAKYETKEEWETAKAELKAAETAYEAARKRAVSKLYATPEYKAAKDKQLKAEQTIQAQQSGPKTNPKSLEAAHQDRLEAVIGLRNLEMSALAGEPTVAEAKAKLDEAKKAWEALQDELKEALAQDPEYLAAQDQLAQAQEAAEQMKVGLAEAAAAERQQRRAAAEAQRGSRGNRSSGRGAYGGAGYR